MPAGRNAKMNLAPMSKNIEGRVTQGKGQRHCGALQIEKIYICMGSNYETRVAGFSMLGAEIKTAKRQANADSSRGGRNAII